jgi:hypothetical protein
MPHPLGGIICLDPLPVDICLLLVNLLDMTNDPTICAAAFHYASLVLVYKHKQSLDKSCSFEESECLHLHQAGPNTKYLCALTGSGIKNVGSHLVKIALNAPGLKSME